MNHERNTTLCQVCCGPPRNCAGPNRQTLPGSSWAGRKNWDLTFPGPGPSRSAHGGPKAHGHARVLHSFLEAAVSVTQLKRHRQSLVHFFTVKLLLLLAPTHRSRPGDHCSEKSPRSARPLCSGAPHGGSNHGSSVCGTSPPPPTRTVPAKWQPLIQQASQLLRLQSSPPSVPKETGTPERGSSFIHRAHFSLPTSCFGLEMVNQLVLKDQ